MKVRRRPQTSERTTRPGKDIGRDAEEPPPAPGTRPGGSRAAPPAAIAAVTPCWWTSTGCPTARSLPAKPTPPHAPAVGRFQSRSSRSCWRSWSPGPAPRRPPNRRRFRHAFEAAAGTVTAPDRGRNLSRPAHRDRRVFRRRGAAALQAVSLRSRAPRHDLSACAMHDPNAVRPDADDAEEMGP